MATSPTTYEQSESSSEPAPRHTEQVDETHGVEEIGGECQLTGVERSQTGPKRFIDIQGPDPGDTLRMVTSMLHPTELRKAREVSANAMMTADED